jgi:hypothetical protein
VNFYSGNSSKHPPSVLPLLALLIEVCSFNLLSFSMDAVEQQLSEVEGVCGSLKKGTVVSGTFLRNSWLFASHFESLTYIISFELGYSTKDYFEVCLL